MHPTLTAAAAGARDQDFLRAARAAETASQTRHHRSRLSRFGRRASGERAVRPTRTAPTVTGWHVPSA